MTGLILDNEKHIYSYENKVIPSVSGIMEAVGVTDYSFIPKDKREEYFERGTYVHMAMELLLQDDLDWDTVDKSISGYVKAGEKFLKDTGFKAIAIEKSMYNSVYNYAGTLDVLGTMGGRTVLLDWKTGKVEDHVRWQTAAYKLLATHNNLPTPVERYGIELKANGKYKMVGPWLARNDERMFLSFVSTYHNQKVRIEDGQTTREI